MARFASTVDVGELDPAERQAAKRHLLDSLGTAIAGATQPMVLRVASLLDSERATGVPVVGLGKRLDALSAAYVTALSCHALEADDGIKPYPCCRHIHPAIDAVLVLRARHHVDADRVDRIIAGTHAAGLPHAAFGWRTLADAQLSFPYVIGAALRSGAVELETFSDVRRASPLASSDAAKVEVVLDPQCAAAYPACSPARVTIVMRDGQEFSATVEEAQGSVERPVSDEFLFRKFRSMTAAAMSSDEADTVIERILSIEQAFSIRPVLDSIFRASPRRTPAAACL